MPQYKYLCPKCHTETTRIVKMSERDLQVCDKLLPITPLDPLRLCQGELVREEVALTAATPYAWRP